MSRFLERIKWRLSHVDKDDALKWGFLVGGGLLTFVANIFDQRKKDRVYREETAKEAAKKIDQLLKQNE